MMVGDEDHRHAALGPALPPDRAGRRDPPPGPGGVGRRPAPDRQAAVAARRVRLHRRRRRGRADAAQQLRRVRPHRVPAPGAAVGGGDRPVDDAARAAAAVPARAGADRLHAHRRSAGRAGRGPGRRAGRPAVHAVDAGHPLDRGGRRGQRRPEVVPGLRLARPRDRQGDGRPLPGVRVRGARADRRHGRARAAGARRPAGLRAAAEARARHAARRRRAPRVDVGVRPVRADRVRQRRRARAATGRATAPTR